jgi:hypothetical protein
MRWHRNAAPNGVDSHTWLAELADHKITDLAALLPRDSIARAGTDAITVAPGELSTGSFTPHAFAAATDALARVAISARSFLSQRRE